jgi:hypothetical protein
MTVATSFLVVTDVTVLAGAVDTTVTVDPGFVTTDVVGLTTVV